MTEQKKYRPEIQGIRAVAALLVAAYHIWFNRVSGAVDVFFVVSSFLVFTSLLNAAERQGAVRPLAFWGRLVKRLLPAAYIVIVAIVVAAVWLLPAVRWPMTIREALASTLYFENWQLASMSVDYLARETPPSPFQHFWALSVQGQFYVLAPLLFVLLIALQRRFKLPLRGLFAAALAVVFTGSLGYSIYLTAFNQPLAYFHTLTRLWEFCIGGFLVLTLPSLRLGNGPRIILGWLGLLGLVSCGALFQVSTGFPGALALWPTLAAALIIVAGTTQGALGADRVLSSPPLMRFGDISYAFYLWHWPLLIFYRVYAEVSSVGVLAGLIIIVIAAALSWATTKFIESPIRFSAIGQARPVRALALGGLLAGIVVGVIGIWGYIYVDARKEDQRRIALDDPDYPGARILMAGYQYQGKANVEYAPGPLGIRRDVPGFVRDGCRQALLETVPTVCRYGDPESAVRVAVVGGSHSGHWIPTFRVLAERHGWEIITMIKSSCRLTTEAVLTDQGKPYPQCSAWNDAVIELLVDDPPTFVFAVGTRGKGSAEHVPDGNVEQWLKLEQAAIPVIAVRDTPWMSFEVAECVERHGPDADRCKRSRASLLAAENPALTAAIPANVRYIDLNRYICPADDCLPVIGNVQVYRDRHHLSATYARTLADPLDQALEPIFDEHGVR